MNTVSTKGVTAGRFFVHDGETTRLAKKIYMNEIIQENDPVATDYFLFSF